jgi:hypothetical protein
MELTVKGIHLLARLSRECRLYAECKGADLEHCKGLAYYNGLTHVRRLRRLEKIRVHCSNCLNQWQDRLFLG